MEGGEQLGRRLSFLDSAAIDEYGIHIKGLSKIVKNKNNSTCAQLHSNTPYIFFVNYQSILIFKE
jgi:hypothetical protein